MFKDYSGGIILVNGRNRIRSSPGKLSALPRELFSASNLMRKTIGALLLATLVIGIGSTVWYGLQVRMALDQIGSIKTVNSELHNRNRLLIAERRQILSENNMQETAAKLGLRSPLKNQLRYP